MGKSQIAGSVVAGFPSPAEQYLEPPLDLNELLVKRPAATYFVRVQGDSMEGKGIYEGDLLVVDRSLDPRDGGRKRNPELRILKLLRDEKFIAMGEYC